ncbi:LacI family DNA-binding transcriptional regulator [Microbacterium timonense]|uniref:LacI family DNA-binding transcriptional regulator n=1 Tax=Microbacterium timonense TaxID=2086576 RepID=UPI001F208A09|nr:LacI family DNA-binding transcriptional regulator [Microbacterium timonense]
MAATVGVSRATVSKALNGRGDISDETRERVLAAVAELGYRPTTGLTQGEGRRALAVVFDIPASPYIVGVLQGVLAAATEAGVDLLTRLAPDRSSRTQRAVAREWVAAQQAAGVVGIIGLTVSRPGAILQAAGNANLPFVMVDPVDAQDGHMVSVGSSNWAGARTGAEYLLELGHRRIAWVGGPEASDAARDRLYGYQAALDAAGVAIDPDLIRSGQFAIENGAEHARDLLMSADPPTAIMAGDDEIAVGVLATAHELGIRVPEELSVMGFDDTPQAAWTTPPLTTVHQHLEGMGAMAVQTALSMAEGHPPSSRHVELATSLMVRDSTAPASSGR